MNDLISRLSEIRSNYNCMDEKEEPYYRALSEAIQQLSAQPEIIRCKECKHRPKATRADEKIFYGFSVKFPDEKCPCYCEDGWYGWYPDDDFYCGYAERGGDEDGTD